MTVRRKIDELAFKGKRVLTRGGGGNPKIQVIASGTGAEHKAGILFYSSATNDAFIMIDSTGTGIRIGY